MTQLHVCERERGCRGFLQVYVAPHMQLQTTGHSCYIYGAHTANCDYIFEDADLYLSHLGSAVSTVTYQMGLPGLHMVGEMGGRLPAPGNWTLPVSPDQSGNMTWEGMGGIERKRKRNWDILQ